MVDPNCILEADVSCSLRWLEDTELRSGIGGHSNEAVAGLARQAPRCRSSI